MNTHRCNVAAFTFVVAIATAAGATQIPPDDFRISDMGTLGAGGDFYADFAHVAYNPLDNEYLVVWSGDDDVNGNANNELEIFAQRIDAATGAELGANDFRISDMGDDNVLYGASLPRVVFNVTREEYLVVWEGDDNVGGMVNDEIEIFGQRLDRTGTEIGDDDFRISHQSATGSTTQKAQRPAVAWSSVDDEYLVVWVGDRLDESVETEVFGQRLDGDGSAIGGDFRISDIGIEGPAADFFQVQSLDVAYNPTAGEYLVVWSSEEDLPSMSDGELEIFGQRITAATGAEVGSNDFRISDVGTNNSSGWAAELPQVAYNPVANEYLVVFRGEDNVGGLVNDEHEIFGQRLSATGAEVGANDFRISSVGGTGNVDIGARKPAVAVSPTSGNYQVAWEGYFFGNRFHVYGQLLSPAGLEVAPEEQLSNMTGFNREAFRPAVAFAGAADQFLVVWAGGHDTLALNEFEVFGQRVTGSTPLLSSGFEPGNLSEWSGWTP
jgi:hypothetical protein